LPDRIRFIIEDNDNDIYVSHASIWEMSIKISLDKLKLKQSLSKWEEFLLEYDFTMLPNKFSHYEALLSLPHYHGDPFDRLMIAQAIVEDFTVITHDKSFLKYSVKLEHF
jgi:PIN domain nuclease of toxin-antitoxin system